MVLTPFQNVKPIREAVFKISRSQAIVDGWTAGPTDGWTDRLGHSIIRPVFPRAYKMFLNLLKI